MSTDALPLGDQAWDEEIALLQRLYQDVSELGGWESGPTSMMGVIEIESREIYHSRVIAWLLDPEKRHGLGDRFLRAFVTLCGRPDPGGIESATVRREVSRRVQGSTRLADIVVHAPGFTLVIENKVDSGEMPSQCDDLYRAYIEEPNPIFVFLTPTGRPPITTTIPSAVDAFRLVSYVDMLGCLRTLVSEDSLLGRSPVVQDYVTTLQEARFVG